MYNSALISLLVVRRMFRVCTLADGGNEPYSAEEEAEF